MAAVDRTISELISYRISRVGNSLSRSAAVRYREECGVTIGEWRFLALLGQDGETTVNRLARRAALDKAQASRVLTGLVGRGLVSKKAGPRRSSVVELSDAGREMYARLIGAANERDDLLRASVSEGQLLVFLEVLERFDALARGLEQEQQTEG